MQSLYVQQAEEALQNNREPGARRVAEVMHFRVLRTSRIGDEQDITVRISQSGTANYLWRVEASSDDGKTAYGNGADTIQGAVSTVHWEDLD